MPDVDTIDINDPALQQEMVEADPEANFFEAPPPPPDDREYEVRIVCEEAPKIARQAKKGEQKGKGTGPLYANFSLTLRIVAPNEPWDNQPVFDKATSMVMENSGTSRLHSILRAVRAPALGRMTLRELIDHATNVFATEPTAFIEGEWESSIEAPGNKRADKGGYVRARRGMQNFVKDDTKPSGYNHVWDDPELGPAPAKFRVTNYIIR